MRKNIKYEINVAACHGSSSPWPVTGNLSQNKQDLLVGSKFSNHMADEGSYNGLEQSKNFV